MSKSYTGESLIFALLFEERWSSLKPSIFASHEHPLHFSGKCKRSILGKREFSFFSSPCLFFVLEETKEGK
jgi:hypothetical protein